MAEEKEDHSLNKHESESSMTLDPTLDDPYQPVQVKDLAAGYELFCQFVRNIAMLPLEEWLQGLDNAEIMGPILDPTLYRDYLYSEKAQILKDLITKAIPLKRAVLAAQPLVRREAFQRESSIGSSTRQARARSNTNGDKQ